MIPTRVCGSFDPFCGLAAVVDGLDVGWIGAVDEENELVVEAVDEVSRPVDDFIDGLECAGLRFAARLDIFRMQQSEAFWPVPQQKLLFSHCKTL